MFWGKEGDFMNSIQIEYFIGLCETLSFTKTAQKMFVSEPAVSKQISSLEGELGLRLFDRNNKAVSLTQSGELFYKFFTKSIGEYNKTIKKAKSLTENGARNITIGFLEAWDLSKFLPYIAQSLLENYPNYSINFVSYGYTDLKNKVESGDIDIAISILHNFDNLENINTKEVGFIHALLFYSVVHPLADKSNPEFLDFKDETFFVISDSSKINAQDRIIKLCNNFGFTPNISVVPNTESMLLNVENGLGVAVFDDLIQHKNNPMLKYINTGYKHKVVAAWKDNDLNDFAEFLIYKLSPALR